LTVQVDVTSTTSLYPSPIKRGEVEARSVFIPSFLSDFAPYQLSSGCSCFITPLPTPTYTVVAETLIFTYKHATVRILFQFLSFRAIYHLKSVSKYVCLIVKPPDHPLSSSHHNIHNNNEHLHNYTYPHHRRTKLLPHKRMYFAQYLLV
jgi:hypothetical protein